MKGKWENIPLNDEKEILSFASSFANTLCTQLVSRGYMRWSIFPRFSKAPLADNSQSSQRHPYNDSSDQDSLNSPSPSKKRYFSSKFENVPLLEHLDLESEPMEENGGSGHAFHGNLHKLFSSLNADGNFPLHVVSEDCGRVKKYWIHLKIKTLLLFDLLNFERKKVQARKVEKQKEREARETIGETMEQEQEEEEEEKIGLENMAELCQKVVQQLIGETIDFDNNNYFALLSNEEALKVNVFSFGAVKDRRGKVMGSTKPNLKAKKSLFVSQGLLFTLATQASRASSLRIPFFQFNFGKMLSKIILLHSPVMMEAFLTGKGLFELLQTGISSSGNNSVAGAVGRVFQMKTRGCVPKAASLFFNELFSLFPTKQDMRNLLEVCIRVSPPFFQVVEQFRAERNGEERRKKLSVEGRLSLEDLLVYFKMKYLSDEALKLLCKILKPYGGPKYDVIKNGETTKLKVARNNFPGVSYLRMGAQIEGQVVSEIKGLQVIEINAFHKAIIKFLLRRSLRDTKFFTTLALLDAARVMKGLHTLFSFQLNGYPFIADQSPYSLQKLDFFFGSEEQFKEEVRNGLNFLFSINAIKYLEDGETVEKTVRNFICTDFGCLLKMVELPEGCFCVWCGAYHKEYEELMRLYMENLGTTEQQCFQKEKTKGVFSLFRFLFLIYRFNHFIFL